MIRLTLLCMGAGFILGRYMLGLLTPEVVDSAKPLLALALGWVGLILGENLEWRLVKRVPLRVLLLTAGQVAAVFGLVYGALSWFLTEAWGWETGRVFPFAVFAACVATTTDPSAALRFLSTRRGRGQIFVRWSASSYIAQVATLNNVATALLFAGILAFLTPWLGESMGPPLVRFALLDVGFGLAIGFILSFLMRSEGKQEPEPYLALSATVLLAAVMALGMDLSPLTICLFASAVLFSRAPPGKKLSAALHRLERPIYLLLLVLAGSLFDPPRLLAFLPVLLIYAAARAAGKVGGTWALALLLGRKHASSAGLGLLSQAGMALVLGLHLQLQEFGDLALPLLTIFIGGIVLNQFLGWAGFVFLGTRRPLPRPAS